MRGRHHQPQVQTWSRCRYAPSATTEGFLASGPLRWGMPGRMRVVNGLRADSQPDSQDRQGFGLRQSVLPLHRLRADSSAQNRADPSSAGLATSVTGNDCGESESNRFERPIRQRTRIAESALVCTQTQGRIGRSAAATQHWATSSATEQSHEATHRRHRNAATHEVEPMKARDGKGRGDTTRQLTRRNLRRVKRHWER